MFFPRNACSSSSFSLLPWAYTYQYVGKARSSIPELDRESPCKDSQMMFLSSRRAVIGARERFDMDGLHSISTKYGEAHSSGWKPSMPGEAGCSIPDIVGIGDMSLPAAIFVGVPGEQMVSELMLCILYSQCAFDVSNVLLQFRESDGKLNITKGCVNS
ncbi:hypothetical protein F5Y14DRAFT_306802 [Nemania sp. NC0429]|nr:hypothetical protein F5Y14DRAFT_306802 [Nemania sp. NC0429]